jgi:hypothetical protein
MGQARGRLGLAPGSRRREPGRCDACEPRALDTKNKATAKHKLARLVAEIESGVHVEEAEAKAAASETYRSFTLARRRVVASIFQQIDELLPIVYAGTRALGSNLVERGLPTAVALVKLVSRIR